MSASLDFEVSDSLLMAVPVAAVWEVTDDPGRNSEWCNNVDDVTNNLGRAQVGNSFTETSVVVGRWTTTTTWTVRSIELMKERTFSGTGFPGVGEIQPFLKFRNLTDESGNEYAHVTYGARFQPRFGPLSRVFAALVKPMLRSEFTRSLANLESVAARELRRDA